MKSLHCSDHHPIRIGDERGRLVAALPVMTKNGGPARGKIYSENGLVKPPRRDTRAFSPAGMFGGKAPLRHRWSKGMMNTASKLGPHTQTDRGTCPGVGSEFTSNDAALQGGVIVVLMPLFAAALVVRRRYL